MLKFNIGTTNFVEDFRKSTSANVCEKEKVNKERDTGSDKDGKEMEEDFLSFGFLFFSRSFNFGISFSVFGSRIRIRFVGGIRSRVRRGIWNKLGSGENGTRTGGYSSIFGRLFVIIFF